jgi:AraC family transcriptional regulator
MRDNQQNHEDTPSKLHAGVLRTSERLSWSGVLFEQRYHPAGEYIFPALSSHMICLYQGSPLLLEQIRDGHTHTSVMPHGGIQIVPAGTASTWRHQAGANNLHILLSHAFLQQLADELNQSHIEICNHFSTQDTRIEHVALALLTELMEGGSSGRLYAEGLVTALASRLLLSYTSEPKPLPEVGRGLSAPALRRITDVIEDRLTEDLGLAELAFEAGLSQSHFSSLFRRTTGLSPHQYIVQRRLARAQALLQATNLSIGEIATSVGFYDQSHLVRHMRRALGITPRYVREHLS